MKVHADIDGLAFAAMQGLMLHEAQEHGLPVLEQTDGHLKVDAEYGCFSITDRGNVGLRLAIEADNQENLFILRDSLVGHIEYYLPDVAKTICWSDRIDTGAQPPNFQFAELIARETLTEDFIRLTLRLSKPALYDDRAIHFRFVLPERGNADPDWPVLAENGSVRWPQGDKALHRPVYTVRAQRGAEVDVDVYRHEGGMTTGWAETVAPGAKVAMIGPGGAGVPDAASILLAGDETAFPAMARILDNLPNDAAPQVIALSHTGARDYPFPDRPGMVLDWQDRSGFVMAVEQALQNSSDRYVWVAAEADQVKAIRKSESLKQVTKTNRYIGAFWTQGQAAFEG